MVIGVTGGEFCGDFSDAVCQDFGFEYGGMCAPGKDPAFDFFEGRETHGEAAGAVGEVGDLLGLMPEAAADHIGGPRVEVDDDFVVAVAFEHGEAAVEVVVEIEGAVGCEFIADEDWAADSAKDEGAKV